MCDGPERDGREASVFYCKCELSCQEGGREGGRFPPTGSAALLKNNMTSNKATELSSQGMIH